MKIQLSNGDKSGRKKRKMYDGRWKMYDGRWMPPDGRQVLNVELKLKTKLFSDKLEFLYNLIYQHLYLNIYSKI